jgi:hypothetical protein
LKGREGEAACREDGKMTAAPIPTRGCIKVDYKAVFIVEDSSLGNFSKIQSFF